MHMENGYYISAYLSIDPLANLYDISIRHDQTIALWRVQDKKVELVRYWELERKTGLKKHSKSFFFSRTMLSYDQYFIRRG